MKRRRLTDGGSVTGGTGDIKPQLLTEGDTQAVVNQYQVKTINLPVPRFGTQRSKATIFEVLSVEFFVGGEDNADLSHVIQVAIATTDLGRVTSDSTSAASLQVDRRQANIIAMVNVQFQTTTSGGGWQTYPKIVNLTDNNGNGTLVATDKLFLIGTSLSATSASSYSVRILYRQVNVGVQEYVGIVQSQLQ